MFDVRTSNKTPINRTSHIKTLPPFWTPSRRPPELDPLVRVGAPLVLLLEDLGVERGVPPGFPCRPLERDGHEAPPAAALLRHLRQVHLQVGVEGELGVVVVRGVLRLRAVADRGGPFLGGRHRSRVR